MLYQRPKVVMSPSLPENICRFNKAKDIHSKMAIFFDENFYSDNRDDFICYQYMYLIYYMLACKKKYFTQFDSYDSYAQFAATTIYNRFLRKQKHGTRIKSILNYAKSTSYPLKIMWQNQAFQEVTNVNDSKSVAKSKAISSFVHDSVQSTYTNIDAYNEEIKNTYDSIPKMIEDVINNTPYKNNRTMFRHLYVSCLLTLLKSFTLSNSHIDKIVHKKLDKAPIKNDMIIKMYAQEVEESTTLWRLDDSMSDFIKILANKVRSKLYSEIRQVKEYYLLPDSDVDNIINSAWESTSHIKHNKGDEE